MIQNASSDKIRITSQFIDEQCIFNKFLPASYLQMGIFFLIAFSVSFTETQ